VGISKGSKFSFGQPIDTRNVNGKKKRLVQQITNSKLCKVVNGGNLGKYLKPSP
jgi:hypothetical protein